jgi:hypothetical protein
MMITTLLLSRLADVQVTPCSIDDSSADCAHIVGANANSGQVTIALQIVFGVIGVLAVAIIIFAGFQLMVSLGGNPEAMSKARKTIIYAAIGLLIAISAEFIVSFVLNKL